MRKLVRESSATHSARPLDAGRLKNLAFMYSIPERVCSSVSTGSKAANTLSRPSASGWYCGVIYITIQRALPAVGLSWCAALPSERDILWKWEISQRTECNSATDELFSLSHLNTISMSNISHQSPVRAQQPLPHINEHWKGSIPCQEDGSPWVEKGGRLCVQRGKQIPMSTPDWRFKIPDCHIRFAQNNVNSLKRLEATSRAPTSIGSETLNKVFQQVGHREQTSLQKWAKLHIFCAAKQTGASLARIFF